MAPDPTTLGKLRFHLNNYPEYQDVGLILYNQTTDSQALDFHEFDLSLYEPIPYYNMSESADEHLASIPIEYATSCTPADGTPGEECNWISEENNRKFICHSFAGVTGITGQVAFTLLVNAVKCTPKTTSTYFGIVATAAWTLGTPFGVSAAINLCPAGFEKLATCKDSSAALSRATSSAVKGDVEFEVEITASNYVNCNYIKQEYGDSKVVCKTATERDEL